MVNFGGNVGTVSQILSQSFTKSLPES